MRHRQVDEILKWEEPYDQVIWLADYFDQFGDTPEQNAEAARWLKGKLEDPRNVCLQGNHDTSYAYPWNNHAYCSGFTQEKAKAIRAVLNQGDFAKLKLAHFEHGILFSHAGLCLTWFQWAASAGYKVLTSLTQPEIVGWLEDVRAEVDLRFSTNQNHPLMGAGFDRGGDQQIGGITWRDFSRHNPIPTVRQIIGHTPAKHPILSFRTKDGSANRYASEGFSVDELSRGWTLNMDTHNKHYAVIQDSVLTIKSVKWERPAGDIDFTVSPGVTIAQINL